MFAALGSPVSQLERQELQLQKSSGCIMNIKKFGLHPDTSGEPANSENDKISIFPIPLRFALPFSCTLGLVGCAPGSALSLRALPGTLPGQSRHTLKLHLDAGKSQVCFPEPDLSQRLQSHVLPVHYATNTLQARSSYTPKTNRTAFPPIS